MSSIMAVHGRSRRRLMSLKHSEHTLSKRSLNGELRKREQSRIMEENHKILKRLQGKRSHYDKAKLGEDRLDKEKIIKNICRFPLPPAPVRYRSVPRKRVFLLCSPIV